MSEIPKTEKPSSDGPQASNESAPYLATAYEELLDRFRASGLTVEETEGSDGRKCQVTSPSQVRDEGRLASSVIQNAIAILAVWTVACSASWAASPAIEAAITQIEKAGGVVTRAGGLPDGSPVAVELRNLNVRNNFLIDHVVKFNELQSLDLENSPFTSQILKRLEAMPNLVRLVLVGTRIDRTIANDLMNRKPALKIGWEHSEDGRKAATALLRANRWIIEESGTNTDRKVRLSRSQATAEEWSRAVELLPEATIVEVGDSNGNIIGSVSDLSIKAIAKLPLLRELYVPDMSRLSARAFESLSGQPTLSKMVLGVHAPRGAMQVSVAPPTILRSIKDIPQLRSLELFAPTDAQLVELRGASKIEELTVDGGNSDTGFAALSSMVRLESLTLQGRDSRGPEELRLHISDKLIDVIAKLNNLQNLKISGAPLITDTGISKLGNVATLSNLHISDTGATNEGYLKLLRQLQAGGNKLVLVRLGSETYVDERKLRK